MGNSDAFRAARQYFAYFNQGEEWVPNGKPPVRIVDMGPSWRRNAAQFLARNARAYLSRYELGEHLRTWHTEARDVTGQMHSLAPSEAAAAGVERELEAAAAARAEDPEAWIKTTALYLALMDGVPSE